MRAHRPALAARWVSKTHGAGRLASTIRCHSSALLTRATGLVRLFRPEYPVRLRYLAPSLATGEGLLRGNIAKRRMAPPTLLQRGWCPLTERPCCFTPVIITTRYGTGARRSLLRGMQARDDITTATTTGLWRARAQHGTAGSGSVPGNGRPKDRHAPGPTSRALIHSHHKPDRSTCHRRLRIESQGPGSRAPVSRWRSSSSNQHNPCGL